MNKLKSIAPTGYQEEVFHPYPVRLKYSQVKQKRGVVLKTSIHKSRKNDIPVSLSEDEAALLNSKLYYGEDRKGRMFYRPGATYPVGFPFADAQNKNHII
ncbi:MAG TPA: hypothetical protein VG870_10995 [Chitinophagaceae bacterium]|nr:hypothetical protein [Chitinophagaceae bacterium]